ncbi:MAG: histidine kinase [Rudaea sp.]
MTIVRSAPLSAASVPVDATIARCTSWLPRMLRTDLRCLDGLSWPLIGGLFAVAFGFAVYSIPAVLFLNETGLHAPLHAYLAEFLGWFVRYVVEFGPVLVAVVIADNIPATGARRLALLTVAVVLGAQLQWPLRCSYEPATEKACTDFPASLWKSWRWMSQNTLWTIGFATPLALVAFSRRRDLRIARALHAAELARVELARRTLETDLQAMQARVEPRFLLDTLDDIGELYAQTPEAGERMLDELIAYLRAALPDMRAASSTLGKEATLARAYLAILRIRARNALVVDVDVHAGIDDEVMPPMVLLPLLAAATGPVVDAAQPTHLRVTATVDAASVRIDIHGRGPAIRAIANELVVADIRKRLRALYEDAASLMVADEAGRTLSVQLSIPREAA